MQHPFVLAVIVLGFAWMWGINRGTAVAADTYKRRQPSSPADVVPIQLTVITTNDMHSSVQCYPITLTPCAIPNTSADTDTARLSFTPCAIPNTMLTLLAFPPHVLPCRLALPGERTGAAAPIPHLLGRVAAILGSLPQSVESKLIEQMLLLLRSY